MARNRLYKPNFRMSTVITMAVPTLFAATMIIIGTSQMAHALEYTDRALMLKDYDQMQDILSRVKTEETGMDDPDDSRRQKGKDALFIVLSRLDRDGSRSALVHNVQSELDEDYYGVVAEVGAQALKFSTDLKISVAERSTYLMVLENLLSEFRPQAKLKLKALYTQVRDANIDPDDEVISYRQIKMMEATPSPSKLAKEILKHLN